MKPFRTLLLIGFYASASTGRAAPVIRAFADGSALAEQEDGITVPHATSALSFNISPDSIRVRYKLDGIDRTWRQKSDQMIFMVRFINREGEQILQEHFPATGDSRGWNGSVETTPFIPRRETVTVPPDAELVSIALSSSGPPDGVGVYAAKGISVTSNGIGDGKARQILTDGMVPGDPESPWVKSGTHPGMATTFPSDPQGTESPGLMIVDDDISAHADWATETFSLPEVVPGEKLEVRWQEAYSIGVTGPFSVGYERVPPGSYQFIVEELGVAGMPHGARSVVTVAIARPYWQQWWFWLAMLAAASGIGFLVGRHLIRRKINRHLRHAQLIADERLRIARDLHDDLGTRLSHISLLGSHAESTIPDKEAAEVFGQITTMSGELIRALSETVWMLNPNNNDLEALINFLCRLVSELCRLADIRCRIDAVPMTGEHPISHDFRHNFSLSAKESVNNALRHSGATEIQMKIWLDGSQLKLSVSDNGTGILEDGQKGGSGLESITQRMASIRGRCSIEELEPTGLRVMLAAPIG